MVKYIPDSNVKLHGVVLAPFDSDSKYSFEEFADGTVTILRKEDAWFHLGGLMQLLPWFAPIQYNRSQAQQEQEADTSVEV